MIEELHAAQAATARADLVVVGSGAGGIALALAAADTGLTVLLLESGGDAGSHGPDHLNEIVTEGRPFGAREGRARVLGGAGALWHGQCTRLQPEQLLPQPWRGREAGAGWPVPTGELDHAYDDAEAWFGLTGGRYDDARWREHPRLAPPEWDRTLLRHDFSEYTPDPDIGRRRRSALSRHPRIRVLTGATVTAVRTEDDAVTGLDVVDGAGRRSTLAASTVALAAGTVENTRLLLLSDPAGVGLGTGREHTGRWLQDHPIVRTAQVVPAGPAAAARLQDHYTGLHRGRRKLFPKVRLAPEVQRRLGLLDANAVLVHEIDGASLEAVKRLRAALAGRSQGARPGDVRAALAAAGPLGRAAWRRYSRGLSSGLTASAVWLDVWLEQQPRADSRITLDASTDAHGSRRARIAWQVSDDELATSRALTAAVGDELRRLRLGTLRATPALVDDDAWRSVVTDAYHPSGTTRMSADPTGGVVDPDLQVHGVAGLYVVGASVFPTAGYANPTLTVVALALRLAAHLGARRPAPVRRQEAAR